jgi:hypothetical protein
MVSFAGSLHGSFAFGHAFGREVAGVLWFKLRSDSKTACKMYLAIVRAFLSAIDRKLRDALSAGASEP